MQRNTLTRDQLDAEARCTLRRLANRVQNKNYWKPELQAEHPNAEVYSTMTAVYKEQKRRRYY